jgi:hypothetical protein
MSSVSRRKFLSLVGGAGAAGALPQQVLALGASVTPAGDWNSPSLVLDPNERFNAAMELVDSYCERVSYGIMIHGLQYGALTASVGSYSGIDRSAKP